MLPTLAYHGWPSAGVKSKCLKIPPHVPQVMIKLSLKCIHWPLGDNITIQTVPFLTDPTRKLEPPHIQPVPPLETVLSSPTVLTHNLKKLLRVNTLNAFQNLKYLNQICPQEPCLQGSETQDPQSIAVRIPLQPLHHLCSPPLDLFQLINVFPVVRSPSLHTVVQMQSHYWLIQRQHDTHWLAPEVPLNHTQPLISHICTLLQCMSTFKLLCTIMPRSPHLYSTLVSYHPVQPSPQSYWTQNA